MHEGGAEVAAAGVELAAEAIEAEREAVDLADHAARADDGAVVDVGKGGGAGGRADVLEARGNGRGDAGGISGRAAWSVYAFDDSLVAAVVAEAAKLGHVCKHAR